jgi:hypothetical protein
MTTLLSTLLSYTKKCVVMFVLVIRQLYENTMVLHYTRHDTFKWFVINIINARKEEKKLYGEMTKNDIFRHKRNESFLILNCKW